MFLRALRIIVILSAILPLAGFRMPADRQVSDDLVYDVRGAFVTARADVEKGLINAINVLVDEAVRATVRSTMLPRAILSVRIEKMSRTSLVIGSRYEARVTVKAISVESGEPVAEGTFVTSVFRLDSRNADWALAERIAGRIINEFRLERQGARPTIASALFP